MQGWQRWKEPGPDDLAEMLTHWKPPGLWGCKLQGVMDRGHASSTQVVHQTTDPPGLVLAHTTVSLWLTFQVML